MSYTLGEIARISGAELDGDPGKKVEGVAPLANAGPNEISFLANKRHLSFLENARAAAVILSSEYTSRCPVDTLVSNDPYLAFVKFLRHIQPEAAFIPGVHGSAVIDTNCTVSPAACIGAGVIIGRDCIIADDVYVGAGCVLGKQVEVGQGTRLEANVTISDGTRTGRNCIFHPGVVIGADGFGIVRENDEWLKIPQIGRVIIGDNVEIGANTTVDRGALQDTIIEDGVKLDNQVQVGHGVRIGAHTAIAGCVAIAGSTTIGRRCMIGGQSAISGHIDIADDVIITGMSGVSNSIKKPGTYSSGVPVTENTKWRKNMARLKNLDEITRRLMTVEKHAAGKEK